MKVKICFTVEERTAPPPPPRIAPALPGHRGFCSLNDLELGTGTAYTETVNAVIDVDQALPRFMTPAWDLAGLWRVMGRPLDDSSGGEATLSPSISGRPTSTSSIVATCRQGSFFDAHKTRSLVGVGRHFVKLAQNDVHSRHQRLGAPRGSGPGSPNYLFVIGWVVERATTGGNHWGRC